MNRRRFVKLASAGLASLSIPTQAQTESKASRTELEKSLTLILDPSGDDKNTGLTLETPILTLARAHDIIRESCKEIHQNVELRIAPGKYVGQKVTWSFTMPEHSIRFLPLFNDSEKPEFVGQGGTWFTLSHSRGQKTNLHFEDLWIQNYKTAISLEGNRNSQQTFNSHNAIYGCYFKDIGDLSYPGESRSTACIRLFNSRYNQIRHNHFVNIINQDGPAYIHAIYLAHYAHHNIIENNYFKDNSGDPVRVRDFSNYNLVSHNSFDHAGYEAAYSEWYCHQNRAYTCTKFEQIAIPECPSRGNAFRDNKIGKNYRGLEMNPGWILYEPDDHEGCKPPENSSLSRLQTSGNVPLETF